MLDNDPTPAAQARHAGLKVFSSLRYFSGNDWTALDDIEGTWSRRYEPRGGRNLAVDLLRAEAGVAYDAWRVGYVRRREIVIVTSRDTLDLLRLEQNNLPIPVGRRFALDLDAESLEAEGIRVQKAFELYRGERAGLWTSLGAAWLRGSRTRSGTVQGGATATAPNTFSFDAAWTDRNTKKSFPFITPGSPEGSGYAVDLALELQWADRNRLVLSIEDIASRIEWRGVPTTEARATSSTALRDAQGFIVYQPAVAGQNSRKDYIQHLDVKTTIDYSREFGPVTVGAGAFIVRQIAMPRASLEYRIGGAWRVSAERDFRFGGVGFGLRYKSLSIAASSERTDLSSAKSYGLVARLAVPF